MRKEVVPVDILCSCGKCYRVCVATSRTLSANLTTEVICYFQESLFSSVEAELKSGALVLC